MLCSGGVHGACAPLDTPLAAQHSHCRDCCEYFASTVGSSWPLTLFDSALGRAGAFRFVRNGTLLAAPAGFDVVDDPRLCWGRISDFKIATITSTGSTQECLEDHLRHGSTLIVDAAERFDPTLRELIAIAEDKTGRLTTANVYVTPTSNVGFNWHWDFTDAWVVQLLGSKVWELCFPETANRNPVHGSYAMASTFTTALPHEVNQLHPTASSTWAYERFENQFQTASVSEWQALAQASAAVPQGESQHPTTVCQTITLHAGDTLSFQRGVLHAPRSLDGVSIHATISTPAKEFTIHAALEKWLIGLQSASSDVILSHKVRAEGTTSELERLLDEYLRVEYDAQGPLPMLDPDLARPTADDAEVPPTVIIGVMELLRTAHVHMDQPSVLRGVLDATRPDARWDAVLQRLQVGLEAAELLLNTSVDHPTLVLGPKEACISVMQRQDARWADSPPPRSKMSLEYAVTIMAGTSELPLPSWVIDLLTEEHAAVASSVAAQLMEQKRMQRTARHGYKSHLHHAARLQMAELRCKLLRDRGVQHIVRKQLLPAVHALLDFLADLRVALEPTAAAGTAATSHQPVRTSCHLNHFLLPPRLRGSVFQQLMTAVVAQLHLFRRARTRPVTRQSAELTSFQPKLNARSGSVPWIRRMKQDVFDLMASSLHMCAHVSSHQLALTTLHAFFRSRSDDATALFGAGPELDASPGGLSVQAGNVPSARHAFVQLSLSGRPLRALSLDMCSWLEVLDAWYDTWRVVDAVATYPNDWAGADDATDAPTAGKTSNVYDSHMDVKVDTSAGGRHTGRRSRWRRKPREELEAIVTPNAGASTPDTTAARPTASSSNLSGGSVQTSSIAPCSHQSAQAATLLRVQVSLHSDVSLLLLPARIADEVVDKACQHKGDPWKDVRRRLNQLLASQLHGDVKIMKDDSPPGSPCMAWFFPWLPRLAAYLALPGVQVSYGSIVVPDLLVVFTCDDA